MLRWSYFCHLRRVFPTVNLPHLLKPMIHSSVVSLCNSAIINLNIKFFGVKIIWTWRDVLVCFFVCLFIHLFIYWGLQCCVVLFAYQPVLQNISPLCHIYASVYRLSTGTDNGLSPIRRQAIIWTNACLLLIKQTSVKLYWKMQKFSVTKSIWRYRSRHGGHFVQGKWVKVGMPPGVSDAFSTKIVFRQLRCHGELQIVAM